MVIDCGLDTVQFSSGNCAQPILGNSLLGLGEIISMSFATPMTLSAKKGDSISLNCSYSMMDDSRRPNNFTWCKMVTATRCQPVVSVEIDKIVNTQGRTRIQTDMRYRVIIVTLVVLQLRDSGEYHCETHLQGSTVLLKMITLNVLATLVEEGAPPHKIYSLIVNFNVLCIMAGLLGTKFLTALLIFIIHSRNKHQLLPLTGNLTECIRGGINPS
uniref:Ig-like domain-containing protein n=1 Tax=Chelydra serpentina TaxID=8475 RepID=A0A8C3RPE3_CHESE